MTPHPDADATLDLRNPFRRRTAVAAGVSAKTLRGPHFQRLLPGVYVSSDVAVTEMLRARAVATLVDDPRAHLSHATATRVLGVPIPTLPEEHVTVTDALYRRAPRGVRCHVRPGASTMRRGGLTVSAPGQLFVELAELLSLVDLVVAGDHLVRRFPVTPAQLLEACAAVPGRPGWEARRAASYVRGRVDSPMETRLRMLLVLAGLPEPQVNPTLRAADGQPLRRYDLCWPGARLVVEYDGRHHAIDLDRWEADVERREEVADDGYRIITVTSRGLHRTPGRTVRRVHAVLADSGLPGVPARPLLDWQPYFPGER